MSEFDHMCFIGCGDAYYAVSKDKYGVDEAREIAAFELDADVELVSDALKVRYGFYSDEDGGVSNGWHMTGASDPVGCEVWVFEPKGGVS